MQETQLNGESLDIVSENVSKLKELFPEIVTEDKVDFDKLKAVLGNYVEDDSERYNFTWKGKADALRLAQTPSTGTLRPCKEESKNWDSTENLYIEGDNLEVLKLLQKSYYGKIKMIYIDPPYNTGKEFVYPDDYKDNLKNYLEMTEQVSSGGKKISTNTDTSGRYHTNWLNMMYPRLRIARNLLTDDGVFFVSIDDNESSNLKKLCDEIFGEENHIVTFYVQVRYANKSLNERDDFQKLIEQVLVYKKGNFKPIKESKEYPIEKFCFEIVEKNKGKNEIIGNRKVTIFKDGEYEINKISPNIDGLKETWASGSVLKGNASGKYFDKFLSSRIKIDGYKILYKVEGIGEDGLGYRYFTGPKKEGATKGKFYSKVPLSKREQILKGEAKKYSPIVNFADFSPNFGNIRNEGNISFRSGKKPVKYLRKFIDMVKNDDFIVMDFFSGSASTAHAVIDKNLEDGGKRKYIMVQLPEKVEENSDYFRDGFKTISDIGKERIRRAGNKIISEMNQNGQTSLDSKSNDLDIGFKVFKLDSSNLAKWDPEYDNLKQTLLDGVENLVPGRNELDLVYEIILKYGIDLTLPIEEYQIQDKKFYSIGFGALIICLDNNLTSNLASEIIKLKDDLSPEFMRVVFKDNGFASDSDKTNIKETLKTHGIEEFVTI